MVDSPSSWPRTDSPVSEVRVAVNDWVNDLLLLRAEVSILDEHLVKVPPSLHEWAFMANHIGAYTRMMYVTSVFRFSDGFLSLTYNRRILLAVVSHRE